MMAHTAEEGNSEMSRSFNEQVYEVVRRIPPGKVATYGLVALALDRPGDARRVGRALHVNPHDDVPCHRVVNRHGVLTGAWAFETPVYQYQTLLAEGVMFDACGRVDLANHLVELDLLLTC